MDSIHARIVFWENFREALLTIGQASAASARRRLRHTLRKPPRANRTRRSGIHSPMWNLCRALLRRELRRRGTKVRLARYLGIPKQRITDFISTRRRLPDAELALQLMYWLVSKQSGIDHSI